MKASAFTLWLIFAGFIVYGAAIPFHFGGDAGAVLERLRHVPLNPFVSPVSGGRLSIPDVVQNILLFLPFGALGFLANDGARPFRRIVFVTMLAAVLSTAVEALQLLTSDRVSSLGDVTMDTAGALMGAVIAWQLRDLVAAGLRRLRAEGLAVDELKPLTVASLLLLIAFWQPFDVTLEVGTVAAKARAFQTDWWQLSAFRDEGTMVMLSAFFAMALASYLSVLGERLVVGKTAVMGIGFVFLLEGFQVFIGSRMPGLWDACVATCGVMIGVVIWFSASRLIWPGFWLGVIVAATLAAAALQMLSPFEVAATYQSFGWFPFLGYYTHTTFETLSHVIELMLLYFPLGYWLSQSEPNRRRALVTGLCLTLAIAVPIEYLQGWIVGRYPDVTDVGLSLAGVWLGLRGYNTRDA